MITYEQLLNAQDNVNDLAKTKLPPRISLRVARNAQVLFSALRMLDSFRVQLIKTHAKLDDKGNAVFLKDGRIDWLDQEAFEDRMQAKLDSDSGIKINPIPLGSFPKKVEFTPVEALALADAGFIKE